MSLSPGLAKFTRKCPILRISLRGPRVVNKMNLAMCSKFSIFFGCPYSGLNTDHNMSFITNLRQSNAFGSNSKNNAKIECLVLSMHHLPFFNE